MLISCPKCHSIYEIPDDLIGKTGRNFRCQNCANVWHALRSDALGYEEEPETPYIEPITVSEPPKRNYPANKTDFKIPADGKSGVKTRSSQELLAEEGDPAYERPQIKPKPAEITLTSDHGTSFTISMLGEKEDDNKKTPYLSSADNGFYAYKEDRFETPKTFKGYKKTTALLFLLLLIILAAAFRREAVAVYPKAETYYNKVSLSGLNNPEYLKFEQVTAAIDKKDAAQVLKVTAVIHNDSFYTTTVPDITVSGSQKTFAPARRLLKGGEKTGIEFEVEMPKTGSNSLTLGFAKP